MKLLVALLSLVLTLVSAKTLPPNVTLTTDIAYTFDRPIIAKCTLGSYTIQPFSCNVEFYLNTTLAGSPASFIPLGSFDTFTQSGNTTFASAGDPATPFGSFAPAGHENFKYYQLAMRITRRNFTGSFGCRLTWSEMSDDGYAGVVSSTSWSNVWYASGSWAVLPSMLMMFGCLMVAVKM